MAGEEDDVDQNRIQRIRADLKDELDRSWRTRDKAGAEDTVDGNECEDEH